MAVKAGEKPLKSLISFKKSGAAEKNKFVSEWVNPNKKQE